MSEQHLLTPAMMNKHLSKWSNDPLVQDMVETLLRLEHAAMLKAGYHLDQPVSGELADKIIEEIICDLSDRTGIEDVWADIPEDIMAEIKRTWKDIINPLISTYHKAEVVKEKEEFGLSVGDAMYEQGRADVFKELEALMGADRTNYRDGNVEYKTIPTNSYQSLKERNTK